VRSSDSARRSDPAAAAIGILAVAVVGIPLGWIWQHFAPRTRAFIAADGRALFLCAGLGVVVGIAAWLWRTRRGPIFALGATAAAAAGAGAMELSGRLFSGGQTTGGQGEVFTLPVAVHAWGVVLIAPILALLVYIVCVLLVSPDDLGRTDEVRADDSGRLDIHGAADSAGRPDGPIAADGPAPYVYP
jgi:hypothetical protein